MKCEQETKQKKRRRRRKPSLQSQERLAAVGRKLIAQLIPEPQLVYPQARRMKRKIVIHSGPTNSGKTYTALCRLKEGKTGTYLGPLRLLAMEVMDRLNEEGFPCSLLTGEEERIVEGAAYDARTVEKADVSVRYEVCIIDECQMIADPERGHSWTRAILGMQAAELHLCCAPDAESLLVELAELCGDTCQIVHHQRDCRLTVEDQELTETRNHDALIVFSRRSVLSLAADIERKGTSVSVIYGSLPYSVRKEEAEKFRTGSTSVVVSTDAIGMGLNLPIRRVVFMETEKFDGTSTRKLRAGEVKQIAGRAGRRGIFEEGFVGYIDDGDLIRESLAAEDAQIESIQVPFPEGLLGYGKTYPDALAMWENYAEFQPPFVRMDVSRQKRLYPAIRSTVRDPKLAHRLCSVPFDERSENIYNCWLELCEDYVKWGSVSADFLERVIPDKGDSIEILEEKYKKMDLIYSFCHSVECGVDELYVSFIRDEISRQIIRVLKQEKTGFYKRCRGCGRRLPWNFKYNICQKCFNRRQASYGRTER